MIAQQFGLDLIVRMFRSTELRVVPIVTRAEECDVPDEYMLYGRPIDRFSHAVAALRDMCDEISRRRRSGIVLPRVIVSVSNPDALILRSPGGEVAELLDILARDGEDFGIELVA